MNDPILKLVEHHLATCMPLPPVDESLMHDYVFASNGVFARGRRPGLEACIPVVTPAVLVRGLHHVEPYVQWGYPKVPATMMSIMFSISQQIARKEPLETLFHLTFGEPHGHVKAAPRGHIWCADGWHLIFPPQRGSATKVELVDQGVGSSEAEAIIEVHSHHYERAFFSEDDDRDEGSISFRLYGVMGTIFNDPTIRMRVGLFGHFFEYPASEFFEMPDGVEEAKR